MFNYIEACIKIFLIIFQTFDELHHYHDYLAMAIPHFCVYVEEHICYIIRMEIHTDVIKKFQLYEIYLCCYCVWLPWW